MGKRYSAKYDREKMAIVAGKALPVSTKQCVEIASFIRGKKLSVAKKLMQEVISMKKAIPFKKFNSDVGHKKGIPAAGRYPQKSCKAVFELLKSVESNAQFKGMDVNALAISHICVQKASAPWRFGRQRRRKAKRSNIEIIVVESAEKSKEKPKGEPKKADTGKEKGMPETQSVSDHSQKAKLSDEPAEDNKENKKEEKGEVKTESQKEEKKVEKKDTKQKKAEENKSEKEEKKDEK